MSSKGRPLKALTIILFVSAKEWAGALEWSEDMVWHISAGNISDLEAAHCPSYKRSVGAIFATESSTLMKAGPARSIA